MICCLTKLVIANYMEVERNDEKNGVGSLLLCRIAGGLR